MATPFLPGRSYLVRQEAQIAAIQRTIELIDQTILDATELGVKELRVILGQVTQTPFGQQRLLVLLSADQLSPILQTTLLKLIEEPPSFLIIILQSTRPDALLATVRSRCQLIAPSSAATEVVGEPDLSGLVQKNRSEALLLLSQWRQALLTQQPISPEKLTIVESAIKKLEHNCNVKLTIDHFLLQNQVLSGME